MATHEREACTPPELLSLGGFRGHSRLRALFAAMARPRARGDPSPSCARARACRRGYSARALAQECARMWVCARARVRDVIVIRSLALSLFARPSLSCAHICARVIFELLELLFSDHARQCRCAAVAAAPRVHGCVRCCHVRSCCFCVRSCCLLFRVDRHAPRRVGSRALSELLRPCAHSFLEILTTAVSAPWRLLLISAADSRATLSRGGSAGGRRRGERTGAAESERAWTRADGRRREQTRADERRRK